MMGGTPNSSGGMPASGGGFLGIPGTQGMSMVPPQFANNPIFQQIMAANNPIFQQIMAAMQPGMSKLPQIPGLQMPMAQMGQLPMQRPSMIPPAQGTNGPQMFPQMGTSQLGSQLSNLYRNPLVSGR